MGPSLHELQLWMRWIFTDPRGVNGALSDPHPILDGHPCAHRFQAPLSSCLAAIEEQPPLSREERLSIYAEAYFSRILENLTDSYALLKRLMGNDEFSQFAADYLTVYPSASRTIADVGRFFPEAIANHPLGRQNPYLIDVAQLEWAAVESFYSPVRPSMDLSTLEGRTESEWQTATFVLDPSVRLFALNWAVDGLWLERKHENADLAGHRPREEKVHVYMLRLSGADNTVERVTPARFRALKAMEAGWPLAKILNSVSAPEEFSPTDFGLWLSRGLIREIRFSPSSTNSDSNPPPPLEET